MSRLGLVLSPDLKDAIDRWRRNQSDLPNVSESLRRLIEIALRVEGVKETAR